MPDPSYTIPEHYPRQFSTNFGHEIQQADSRFKDCIDSEARWTGKEFIFRDLSKNTWTRSETRGGTTVARETQASFRRMFKKKVEAEAIEFYEWDEELLAQIVHPKSAEMQAMRMGYERAFDDLCIEACTEDSMGGPEPHVTAQPFPASQKVAVDYNTPAAAPAGDKPMTSWKLFRAKKMFENLNLDLEREEVKLAISPDEEEDLLVEAQAAPNSTWSQLIMNYFDAKTQGVADPKLLGLFSVIKTTRLPVAAGIRTCVAFLRSGFVKSAADEVKSSLDRIPQDKNKLLLQGSAMVGIARRYDEKFIQILCKH
ncbi:MAG TPA: phage capsid protein [Verrucomicrobiales bacterium]|jgi:hypothetical protein|nr:phage capsid protein [Verrucomicrobiales bacterium]